MSSSWTHVRPRLTPQWMASRGRSRTRTGVRGFADRSLTPRAYDRARPRTDSNGRPAVPETAALSAELRGHGARPWCRPRSARKRRLYRPGGVPPPTTRLG